MKHILQFLVILTFTSLLGAQVNKNRHDLTSSTGNKNIKFNSKKNLKDFLYEINSRKIVSNTYSQRTALVQDTIEYALFKATGLRQIGINNATSAQSISQYFDAPGEVTIRGITFYGWKGDLIDGANVDIQAEIYAVGTDSLPIGSPLITKTISIDTTFGFGSLAELKKEVTFDNPLVVTDAYAVVLNNSSSSSNVRIVFNDWVDNDGEQEWLANFDLFGNWTRPYNIIISGDQPDADALILPHVSYALVADFDMNPPTNNGNNIVTVTSNGPTDGFIENRMYNRASFLNNSDLSYEFDFGDGTVLEGKSITHTYSNSNPQTITLTDSLFGWTNTFVDNKTKVWSSILSTAEFNVSNIQLLPNPAQEGFTIINSNYIINEVSVLDLNGKVVKVFQKEEDIYPIEELNPGVYFIAVKTNKGNGTLKLIKK